MKFIRKIFLIIFLLIILIYVTNITSIPKNIILFEGENLDLSTIFGVFQKKEPIIATSSNNKNSNIIYEETVKLSLFKMLNVKNINVTTIENTKVIPLGNTVGLKLYTSRSISNRNDRNRREKTIRKHWNKRRRFNNICR